MRSALLVALMVAAPGALAEDAPPKGEADRGRSLYTANCLACHGAKGAGDGPAAMALKPKPADLTRAEFWEGKDDEALRTLIRVGRPGTAMTPFPQLSDQDLADLTAYLRTFAP